MREYSKYNNNDKEALETERSGGVKASLSRISPEVPQIPKRRRFTREFKIKILNELEACKMPGGRGMILRREGLFSSQISQWKKDMGNAKKKKKSSADKNELARLKRKIARLEATIERKDYIIEAQKKMREILDNLSKTSEEPLAE